MGANPKEVKGKTSSELGSATLWRHDVNYRTICMHNGDIAVNISLQVALDPKLRDAMPS